MARIRTIKPEFFTSLTIADLPLTARLTFIGLWTHVDDEGRCVDDARLIRAAIWPLDDRLLSDIEDDLKLLTESSLIARYTVSGRSYLAVSGWKEHQRINRPTEGKIPGPDLADVVQCEPVTCIDVRLTEPAVSDHERHTDSSPLERKGREGKGTNTPAEPESPEQFELLPPPNGDGEHMNLDQHWAKFWNAYPRRKEPRSARTAWDKARKTVPVSVIQAGVERYALELAGQDIKFAKYPATWLNAGCWADDPDRPAAVPSADPTHHGWGAYAAATAHPAENGA